MCCGIPHSSEKEQITAITSNVETSCRHTAEQNQTDTEESTSYNSVCIIFKADWTDEWWFSSVQLLSHVRLFASPWTAARQASMSITNSWSPPKPMSIESVMPSNHLILCRPLLLLPSVFPSIRVFSDESAFCIRWPKYWSFSFNISPSSEHPGIISFRMGWLDLLVVQGISRVFSNTTVQKHQFFSAQLSSHFNSHIHTWPLEKP